MLYYIIAAILAVLALVEVVITSNAHECKVNSLLKIRKTLLNDIYENIRGNKLLVSRSRAITITAGLVLSIYLLVMAFARYETGYDYTVYSLIYDQSMVSDFKDLQVEPIYYILNYLLKIAGITFGGFLIAYSLVSILPKLVIIYSVSTYFIVAILIYYVNCFIMYDFGVLRQAAAISLCAFSCIYALNRRPLNFILLVVMAMGFHVTAIIFMPFYYLCRIPLTYRNALFILIAGWVGGEVVSGVIDNLLIGGIPIEFILTRLIIYSHESMTSLSPKLTIGFYSKVMLALFYILLFQRNKQKTNKFGEIACIGYLVSLAGFLFLNKYALIASRLFGYYKFSEIILLPDLIRLQNNKIEKILVTICIIGVQFYQLDRDLNQEYSDVLFPYQVNPDFSLLNWLF